MHAGAPFPVEGVSPQCGADSPRRCAAQGSEEVFAELLALFFGGVPALPQAEAQEACGQGAHFSEALPDLTGGSEPALAASRSGLQVLERGEAPASGLLSRAALQRGIESLPGTPAVVEEAVSPIFLKLEPEASLGPAPSQSAREADRQLSSQLSDLLFRGELTALVGSPAGNIHHRAGVEMTSTSPVNGLQEQLRVLFVQALGRALSGARMEPPTVAQLHVELPHGGQLLLFVAVHGEQVFVHAETPSSELARQFVAAADGLQHMLSGRQLRLGEVTVRFAESAAAFGDFSRFPQGQKEEELYRERAHFVRSFLWHRLRSPTS